MKRGKKKKSDKKNVTGWIIFIIVLAVLALIAVVFIDARATGNVSQSGYTQGRCEKSCQSESEGDTRGWWRADCTWSCTDKTTQHSCTVSDTPPADCANVQTGCSSLTCSGVTAKAISLR